MTPTSPAADATSASAADEGTLRALEFGAIVERLAALTAFEPSRELAVAMRPVADAAHVGLLQDQTSEAGRLLTDQAQASIGGARDIRPALERAARGGRLAPAELLDIAASLEASSASPCSGSPVASQTASGRGATHTWRGYATISIPPPSWAR